MKQFIETGWNWLLLKLFKNSPKYLITISIVCWIISASGNSSSGHPQHRGVIVLTVTQESMK